MHACHRFYHGLIVVGTSLQSPLLFVIRLFWGWLFLKTGIGKFVHIETVMGFFQSLGIPFPEVSAYAVACVEALGGICLLLGLASRLITIPLMFTLVIAFLTGDLEAVKTIFSNPMYFLMRDPFSFLFASVVIFVFGPGAISVDRWLVKTVFNPDHHH